MDRDRLYALWTQAQELPARAGISPIWTDGWNLIHCPEISA